MNDRKQQTEQIFHAVMELAPGSQRLEYLKRVCKGDQSLLHRLEELIDGAALGEAILEAGGANGTSTEGIESGPQPGDHIGRYKLLEKIGEGGCGVVYMAEQEEPVRREVALKLIKPGMDSRSVIARFEAERQALALMDHPNVARIFDAGVTGGTGGQQSEESSLASGSGPSSGSGRPFFVMELVRGIRITEYCSEHGLSTRERLDLFTAVCSAVQHAHQKGIIHRDLKPSNILVTETDGRPMPKVIDFGIAKATEQKLTEKTLFTQFAQFIGTPAYMSPEQAVLSGADIDTRSDIYSLGVLLYEILTGTTPFDAQELINAGFDEMRRIIRETEPPKPSTRLTQTRRVASPSQPPTRHSPLATDLDWIVMKALEKDRARRYESASSLAMDIQRHLNNEPVTARPAGAAHRLGKLVRRNKLAFTAAAAVLAALATGLGVSTWMFVKEKHARDKERQALERALAAEQEQSRLRQLAEAQESKATTEAEKSRQVAQFLKDMLKGVAPSAALGDDTKMLRKILDKTGERIGNDLKDQPEVEAELRTTIGKVYDALGDYKEAAAMLREALAITKKLRGNEHKEVVYLLNALAQVLGAQGDLAGAEAMLRDALEMQRKLVGEGGDVTMSLNNLGTILGDRGKLEEAAKVHREALAMNRKFAGNESADVATSLGNLAVVLQEQQRPSEAETALREALAIERKLFVNEHPAVATTLNNLANVVQLQNRLAESEALFHEVVSIQRKLLGNAHPNVAAALNGLGLALLNQGRAADAAPYLKEAVEIERKARKSAHPETANIIGNLGRVMEGLGRVDEAEALYREALAIHSKVPGPEHPAMASWRNQLFNLLFTREKWPELEAVMREDLASARRAAADGRPQPAVAEAQIYLAGSLREQQKFPEAETLLLEANDAMQQKPGDQRELRHNALSALVSLYQSWGKPDKASEWRLKLAAFAKEQSGAAAGKDPGASKH